MNIGRAAQVSGLSAKMIRYYEAIGLAPQPGREASGYRAYGDADVQRLRFIRRARELGFPLERVKDLLALWSDRNRHSGDVKVLALAHIAELEERAAKLKGMIRTLRTLAQSCEGDARPDCPIIGELEAGKAARNSRAARRPMSAGRAGKMEQDAAQAARGKRCDHS